MSTAVILAAGQSKRLADFFNYIPKSLMKFGDETLLHRNIRLLNEVGVERVLVVTGYRADLVEQHLLSEDLDLLTVLNENFETYGSMFSIKCAFDALNEDLIVVEADLFVPKQAYLNIANRVSDSIIVTTDSNSGDELRPEFHKGLLQGFSKDINLRNNFPEYLGISYFSSNTISEMIRIDQLENFTLSYEEAFARSVLSLESNLDFLYMPNLKWSDLDCESDVNRINRLIQESLLN